MGRKLLGTREGLFLGYSFVMISFYTVIPTRHDLTKIQVTLLRTGLSLPALKQENVYEKTGGLLEAMVLLCE